MRKFDTRGAYSAGRRSSRNIILPVLVIALMCSLIPGFAGSGSAVADAAPGTSSGSSKAKGVGLYYVTVTDKNYPIYETPDASKAPIATVKAAAIYTIMEEVRDDIGNVWGRLKSGAGWIIVTELYKEQIEGVEIMVDHAPEYMPEGSDYYVCGDDLSQYAAPFVLYTSDTVTDLQIWELKLADYDHEAVKPIGTWAEWNPDTAVVVLGSFPLDFSAYGVFFTDSNGAVHKYRVLESGEDSSPVLRQYYTYDYGF